jgi:hypothetical protein
MSDSGASKATAWWVFGTVAIIGFVIAAVAIGSGSGSPRDFIDDTYRCTPDPEKFDSAVCRSSSSPTTVSSEIRRAARPIDSHTDYASGAIFFQYRDYNRGYTRHSTYIGSYWTSTRPGSGYNGGSGGYGGYSGGK